MPRLYHFQFDGINERITIQAQNRNSAREVLQKCLSGLPQFTGRSMIAETCESLVAGISRRMTNGKQWIWNGQTWEEKNY